MDEARERATIGRAQHAKALMDDPLFAEAFAEIDAAVISAWRETPKRDVEAREKLFMAVDTLAKLRAVFGKWMADGEVSAASLRALQDRPNVVERLRGRA